MGPHKTKIYDMCQGPASEVTSSIGYRCYVAFNIDTFFPDNFMSYLSNLNYKQMIRQKIARFGANLLSQ